MDKELDKELEKELEKELDKELEKELEQDIPLQPNADKIKHIVIAGGGSTGFSYYGILKETNKMGIWNYKDIESIYGTSVGGIIAVFLCLQYDWDSLDDYLIKRPWNNVFKFNMYSIIDSYQKRGIFDIKPIEETLLPLFKGKDISIDVTLKEFYDVTNIELHLFASELNSYELIDFSYKTHPEWKVVDVVYSSACLPVMFSPRLIDNKCYCDGGVIHNYPLSNCINNGCNINEILGIRMKVINPTTNILDEKSSLLDYLMKIINNYSKKILVLNNNNNISIKHEYFVESEAPSLYNIFSVLNDSEERIKLINKGVEIAKGLLC